ncbi:hypothetical protein HBH43_159770 [Parastagonospora nodorum]|nr:hypothetical protein HBH43_159770 [Parastagonospora nodorum]
MYPTQSSKSLITTLEMTQSSNAIKQRPKENLPNSAYLHHPPNLHRLHFLALPHMASPPPPLKTGVFLLLTLASRKRNHVNKFGPVCHKCDIMTLFFVQARQTFSSPRCGP